MPNTNSLAFVRNNAQVYLADAARRYGTWQLSANQIRQVNYSQNPETVHFLESLAQALDRRDPRVDANRDGLLDIRSNTQRGRFARVNTQPYSPTVANNPSKWDLKLMLDEVAQSKGISSLSGEIQLSPADILRAKATNATSARLLKTLAAAVQHRDPRIDTNGDGLFNIGLLSVSSYASPRPSEFDMLPQALFQ